MQGKNGGDSDSQDSFMQDSNYSSKLAQLPDDTVNFEVTPKMVDEILTKHHHYQQKVNTYEFNIFEF